MKKIRTCVIDDEPLAAELIAGYIRRTAFLELEGVYSSAQEAVRSIMKGKVDLVFLDIQMPMLGGLEFARLMPKGVRVVFVTAYSEFALDSFKVGAIDYLLKPVSYEEFVGSATRAASFLCPVETEEDDGPSDTDSDYLIVKSEYKLHQIRKSDIVYVEGLKDYVKIWLDGGSRSITTLLNMRSLEKSLPAEKFMRVHRSFIVNLDKIETIERNRIIFDGTAVPVSESYRDSFQNWVTSRMTRALRGDEAEE